MIAIDSRERGESIEVANREASSTTSPRLDRDAIEFTSPNGRRPTVIFEEKKKFQSLSKSYSRLLVG
jgi:hypothetical protein